MARRYRRLATACLGKYPRFDACRAGRGVTSLLLIALAAGVQAEDDQPWRLSSALGLPSWLTVSGSHRTRYESLDGQFRAGGGGSNQLISLRTTLLVEAHAGWFRAGAELIDARAFDADRDSFIGTGEVNAVEPVQAYIGTRFSDVFAAGDTFDNQIGRFTLDLGSRRLVGRNRFRNTTNAFDGLLSRWSGAGGRKLTAFYSLPLRRRPAGLEALLDNEIKLDKESFKQEFWGLHFATASLPAIPGSGELYLFGMNEKDGPRFNSRNRDIVTAGGRWTRAPQAGHLDFDHEGAYQFGDTRGGTNPVLTADLDVRSWFVHSEVGYQFDTKWRPRLRYEFDIASGDKDPTDGKFNRFDSLFGPRNSDFGPTGIFGPLSRSNLVSPGFRIEIKPTARWDGFVSYRAVWLDEARDSFGATGVVDRSGAAGRFAGHQVHGRLRFWLLPGNLRLNAGAAVLVDGSFLKRAPNATGEGDAVFGFFETEVFF